MNKIGRAGVDFFTSLEYNIIRRLSDRPKNNAEWCNGNTNDSDSFCPGSNPGSAAKRLSIIDSLFCCLFFLVYHKKKMTDAFLSVITDFEKLAQILRKEIRRRTLVR